MFINTIRYLSIRRSTCEKITLIFFNQVFEQQVILFFTILAIRVTFHIIDITMDAFDAFMLPYSSVTFMFHSFSSFQVGNRLAPIAIPKMRPQINPKNTKLQISLSSSLILLIYIIINQRITALTERWLYDTSYSE